MNTQFAPPPSSLARLDEALRRMEDRHAFERICAASQVDSALAAGGYVVLLLTDDPQRSPESLDVAVVLPEALASLQLSARRLVADAQMSPELARRYGVQRYPAVVVLRDGAYLGTLSGILDWRPFLEQLGRLAMSAPSRPPIALTPQSERSCR